MKKTLKILLGIVILAVVIVFIFVIYPKNINNNTEPQTKTLTLSKDNFIILEKNFYEYISRKYLSKSKSRRL